MDEAAVAASSAPDTTFVVISRHGEKIAALEAQMMALKEDTALIRAQGHKTNQELQLLVANEYRFSGQLERLAERAAERHEAVTGDLSRLSRTVGSLVELRQQSEGAWWAGGRIVASLTAIFGALAALVGAGFWALGHLAVQLR